MKNNKNIQKTVKRSNNEQKRSKTKNTANIFSNGVLFGDNGVNIILTPPDYFTWYCKCRKSKGTPIALLNNHTGILKWYKGLPKHITRHNCKIKMRFDNAIPLARKSGATTVLEVWVLKPEPKRY
tara:strand:+ start:81 stop:455 length:375 start_codon:yes stop_codon:yes gene_type:complete